VAVACPQRLVAGRCRRVDGLGWINSRIILGVVFFVVVTPIGLIMRLFGKDLLRMRTPKSSTYWIKRDKPLDPQSLRNQF
jgi:hypothetical protein